MVDGKHEVVACITKRNDWHFGGPIGSNVAMLGAQYSVLMLVNAWG